MDKGKPDAAALKRASSGTLDATKALEQARNFLGRDSDAGVGDGKLGRRAIARRLHANRNLSDEGKLESIRHEVKNDLFPHVAVDVAIAGQRRAVDDQLQPDGLGHRAEV